MMTMKTSPGKEKFLIAVACVTGVFLVAYGMIQKNHTVFLVGIVAVIGGYLAVRRKIKETLHENKHS
ncbi:MAG: hypothetical protein R6X07_01055 [Desulfatiglandales bacterium]